MPISLDAQRTIERAEIWALFMVLSMLGPPKSIPTIEVSCKL